MSVDASQSALAELQRFYRGRTVLITGHTGFKGGWLALWLARLGANVHCCSLAPDQGPHNLFEQARVAERCRSRFADIRDVASVREAFAEARPEIVFHLAARALVQHGYEDPLATFATNVMGTANVLEAARERPSVAAVVCVTTDKVYLNREWAWPYRETDELGGLEAYSASKSAAEMVARAYQAGLRPKDRPFRVGTARGGNVVGGGDWSPHRLVPDIVRAIAADQPLTLRYPGATRPWQHVLELCYGYLRLGVRLTEETQGPALEEAWNFGPALGAEMPVSEVVEAFLRAWGRPDHPVEHGAAKEYESIVLRLDSSRANRVLGWRPRLDTAETIAWSAEWYGAYVSGARDAGALVDDQITRYEGLLDAPAAKLRG